MDTKRLIDAIVRQTRILIAQISTAAGLRSPLSHVADQVLPELSRELESQGVTRKVAADMFGLALRSYQKKIQRLSESATYRDRTLCGAVVGHLPTSGGVGRKGLYAHFRREDLQDRRVEVTFYFGENVMADEQAGATRTEGIHES